MRLTDKLDLGSRPDVHVATGVPTLQTPSGSGGEMMGRAMSDVGRTLKQVADREALRLDEARAEAAINKAKETAIDYTEGDEGYRHRKGQDVIDNPIGQEYSDRYSEALKGIESELGNQRQREIFSKRAAPIGQAYQASLKKHINSEVDEYHTKTALATIDLEKKSAQKNWNNPAAIAESKSRIEYTIAMQGERNGWSDKIINSAKQDAVSELHASIIDMALIENPDYAMSYYKANKKDITGDAAKRVANNIDDEYRMSKALKEGEALGQLGSMKEIYDATQDIKDNKLKAKIRTVASAEYNRRTQAYEEQKKRMLESQYEELYKTGQMPKRIEGQRLQDYAKVVTAHTSMEANIKKAQSKHPEAVAIYNEVYNTLTDENRRAEARTLNLWEAKSWLTDSQWEWANKEQQKILAGKTNASKYKPQIDRAWMELGGKTVRMSEKDKMERMDFTSTIGIAIQQAEVNGELAPAEVTKIIDEFVMFKRPMPWYRGDKDFRDVVEDEDGAIIARAIRDYGGEVNARNIGSVALEVKEKEAIIDQAIDQYNKEAEASGAILLDKNDLNTRVKVFLAL